MIGYGSKRIYENLVNITVKNQTVIWVDTNIDILKIDLNASQYVRDRHDLSRLIINGGSLNATMAAE